jgi:hypothetical protein
MPAHKLGVEKTGGRGVGDAAAAGDKQLGSFAAGKMKYDALCIQWQVSPRGDVPSESWDRWPYLRGGLLGRCLINRIFMHGRWPRS